MPADDAAPPARWLTAEEATTSLGVSRQTLYAYVSRNRIGVTGAPDDPRRSLYDAADVRRLAERNRNGRSRRAVAASTISWGEPILVSAITRIEGGRLEYRGQDAIALSATATLEDVAALLWQVESLPRSRSLVAGHERAGPRGGCRTVHRRDGGSGDGRPVGGPGGQRSARRRADPGPDVLGGGRSARFRRPPSSLPMHERLASAWGAGPKAADLIRRALVLTADHELNASTYATRIVASTRAPLGACVLAGLAALVGPLHGGMTNEIRHLLADPQVAADPSGAIADRLARGERIPAFGHPLYPGGDPRAAALLSRMQPPPGARRLIEAMQAMTGIAPNIDCALLVLEQRLRLPTGAAFAIFAAGRTVGWIAHALEQWRDGTLIRPRAVYPGTATDGA